MLRGLVPADQPLTEADESKIQEMQDEIDAIWSKRGDYKIDEDGWKTMPIFMENISEEDVAANEGCAAMASIVYEEVPPEELAENRKIHGNDCLKRAMNPDQVNKDNMARAAVHCYTEGLAAAKDKANDRTLVAQLYSNRSMAHFIMKNYGHALMDAQRAILVDQHYNKGYYRGAKAAERIRKYEVALNLIDKGQTTVPPPSEAAMGEFAALRKVVEEAMEAEKAKVKKDRTKDRVSAAETSNILRAITSKGIRITQHNEISSEQMSQLRQRKAYFGASDDMLHVPILFMYDEYQMTDFMHDVSCDCCLAEVLDEMMPFPWDAQGRYRKLNDIVAVFKIDDGVAMPQYHAFDLGWPLIEVFRQEEYRMPMTMLPVIHIISRHSETLLESWGLTGKV